MRHERGCLKAILGVTLLFASVASMLYSVWCVGWWDADNVTSLETYRCNCPRLLKTARLPKGVDLVASGCDAKDVIISPSRRRLLIFNYGWDREPHRIVELATRKVTEIKWPAPELDEHLWGRSIISYQVGFLSDEALLVRMDFGRLPYEEPHVLNYRTGEAFALRRLCAQTDKCLSLPSALKELRSVDKIYLMEGLAVGIWPEYGQNPDRSFYIEYESIEHIQNFLRENDIDFQLADSIGRHGAHRFQHDIRAPEPQQSCLRLMSPDGRFYYRHCDTQVASGIYSAAAGRRLVDAVPGYEPMAWSHDSAGILLTRPKECISQWFSDACDRWSPINVLELEVPDEHLEDNALRDGFRS